MKNSLYPKRRLADVGVELLDCDHKTPAAASEGYPYIAIPNIRDGRLELSEVRLISEDDYLEWTKKTKPQAGDVIVTRRARVGDTAVVLPGLKCALGQNLVILRSNGSQIDQAYLRWVLQGPDYWQEVDKYLNVGAVFDSLNCGDIPKFEVPIPPLPEQRAIAHILGTLDDKIELNRRMNATLEAMARAIFKSWFVDFDTVHAKACGERPAGMHVETAALFPDSFEESELGLIPRGWKVEPIGKHIKATKGLSYKGSGLADEGIPMHNLNSVYEGGGYKYEGIKFYTGDYRERHLVKPGDVIVTNTEQGFDLLLIGYAAIVPNRFGDQGLFSHHLYRVRPKPYSPLTSNFIYHLFVSPVFHSVVAGYSNGTTVNMLPPDSLEKPLFAVPSTEIIEVFEAVVKPMRDKMELHYEESVTLSQLRNTLLPKLISGEVCVPDAESVLGT